LLTKFSRAGLIGLALAAFGICAFGEPPNARVIAEITKQFDDHPLIMIGELHRWEQLHAFMREMIRDPGFICRADDVVVEFGNARFQDVADRYVAGADVPERELEKVWRETAVPLTWNSPVYRQFFATVREINEKRLCRRPIRVLLADPPMDWSKIRTAKEYEAWTDRDASFAAVVEREVLAKNHRALLVAGQFHVVKQVPKGDREGPRAAQLIERKHPRSVFSIVAAPPPAAKALHLDPAPSFKVVRGSGLEAADFSIIATIDPQKWPPTGDVVDGILNVGEQTFAYPSPTIYRDPAYQRELRRRAAIIKEYNGQDFISVIEELFKEARNAETKKP
jgi:hypothetical protein